MKRIEPSVLHGWVAALFERVGSSAREAELAADHLVGANLAGHDSHGVSMIPLYVDACRADFLKLDRDIEVLVDTGPMLVVDGHKGVGQSVAHQAMLLAIERAQVHGIALLGLKNAHHIGRIGHWSEMAIDAGLVGIHFTNAMTQAPVVAPHGGASARYLTNPFTVGIPRRDGPPLLLDFATSAIAHGKARVAMNAGRQVPPGTVIDANGVPTLDPECLFTSPLGALKTFADHKGHALAMVCELLGAAMIGGVTGRPEHMPKQPGVINNMLAILFDPARLGAIDSFEHEATGFIEWVCSAPRDAIGEELGGILIPGDPERRSRAERGSGIPLDDGTLAALASAATMADDIGRSRRASLPADDAASEAGGEGAASSVEPLVDPRTLTIA